MASVLNSYTRLLPQFGFLSRTHVSFVQIPTAAKNGFIRADKDNVKKRVKETGKEELEVLWDDGYGETTVKDYLDVAKDFIHFDGGPPRWFCPLDCGQSMKGSPLLLYLPGIDGLGLGLCLHNKTLGRVFEVRCFHIPVYDRTPFSELVRIIENTVRLEHAIAPDKPIYLVGDTLGACLALAVAARNPSIDLVLILVNPATSIGKSSLQTLFPILEVLPDELNGMVPYLLSSILGDPIRMVTVGTRKDLPPMQMIQQLSANLNALLPHIMGLADILPRETLQWKLKMLQSGASYANSRLVSVKAEVLLLASGQDNILPSSNEARRLSTLLQNCTVRYFKDNGHALLFEDGVHLLSIIKGTLKYRRRRRQDFISDYVPSSVAEFKLLEQGFGLRHVTSPVMLSTLDDGKIVRGLSGVPNRGPILFVGNHMLLALDSILLVEEFLREKKIMVRALAHPVFFSVEGGYSLVDVSFMDRIRNLGPVPVTPKNLYSLLASNAFVLLYPGGVREALHRKGEEYKLFWPEHPEFVRMAARFDAKIVPFGVVGEDDCMQLVVDYNDQMNTPIVRDFFKKINPTETLIRNNATGELANQELHYPGVLPKIPGRIYYLFGKPIETKGRRRELLSDEGSAKELYTQIKSEVESTISYLKEEREKDPYRGIGDRIIYRALLSLNDIIPTFEH